MAYLASGHEAVEMSEYIIILLLIIDAIKIAVLKSRSNDQ